MFGNVGWGEMVIIVIVGLVVLGPERLPGAMSWLARSLKQVRAYATGAQTQLKEELGPEFEDLRKPLSELQSLRGMTPRAAITKHLLDGDDSLFTGEFPQDGDAASTAGAGRESALGKSSHGGGAVASEPESSSAGSVEESPAAANAAAKEGPADTPAYTEGTGPPAGAAPSPQFDGDAT